MLAWAAGTAGGIARLGWSWPAGGALIHHGALMVGGFLGSLIGLERAIALQRPWAFLAPLFSGMGAVSLLILPDLAAPMLILASLGLIGVSWKSWRQQPAPHHLIMSLGAAFWLLGNLKWWSGEAAAGWWQAFLVVTILGERVELNRVLPPHPLRTPGLVTGLACYTTGLILSKPWLSGVGLLALSVWLLTFDVARRTLGVPGLPSFMAVCLVAGYLWLGAAGIFQLVPAPRDAQLHAVFLGFVFSMIFAHAPLIFPAILGRPLPFHPVFYGHLALLHGSLLLRVAGYPLGAWLNGAALALFVATTLGAVLIRSFCRRPA